MEIKKIVRNLAIIYGINLVVNIGAALYYEHRQINSPTNEYFINLAEIHRRKLGTAVRLHRISRVEEGLREVNSYLLNNLLADKLKGLDALAIDVSLEHERQILELKMKEYEQEEKELREKGLTDDEYFRNRDSKFKHLIRAFIPLYNLF